MNRLLRPAPACAAAMTRMAALLTCCLFLFACEVPSVEYEFQRVDGRDTLKVTGVPDDVDAMVSVGGADPVPLSEDRIIVLPSGLSGEVMISVGWSSGTFIRTSGQSSKKVDLDEARAQGESR